MAEAEKYYYEKYDVETGDAQYCPPNDDDAKITGKHIIGLKEYFDENPDERKRLGWIKHITHKPDDIIGYDAQTMYALKSVKTIDEYTVEDVYHLVEKPEEMMLFEEQYEMLTRAGIVGGITFFGGEHIPL